MPHSEPSSLRKMLKTLNFKAVLYRGNSPVVFAISPVLPLTREFPLLCYPATLPSLLEGLIHPCISPFCLGFFVHVRYVVNLGRITFYNADCFLLGCIRPPLPLTCTQNFPGSYTLPLASFLESYNLCFKWDHVLFSKFRLNPLNPGTFCQKRIFRTFSALIWTTY